ncbi:MAG: 6-phosphofructokinase [Verrucomicrobiales bacterium]
MPGIECGDPWCRGAANTLGWEVVGFRDGFEGLLPPGDYKLLKRSKTQGILKLGGTILGTTNRGHFSSKQGAGETVGIERQLIEDAKKRSTNWVWKH